MNYTYFRSILRKSCESENLSFRTTIGYTQQQCQYQVYTLFSGWDDDSRPVSNQEYQAILADIPVECATI